MVSRMSEITPTTRGGSKTNGGNRKPVMLVKIVVARNNAVQPPNDLPTNRPYKTT